MNPVPAASSDRPRTIDVSGAERTTPRRNGVSDAGHGNAFSESDLSGPAGAFWQGVDATARWLAAAPVAVFDGVRRFQRIVRGGSRLRAAYDPSRGRAREVALETCADLEPGSREDRQPGRHPGVAAVTVSGTKPGMGPWMPASSPSAGDMVDLRRLKTLADTLDREAPGAATEPLPLTFLEEVRRVTGSAPVEPWLSREDAAELARLGPFGDGEFADVDPATVPWGTPLPDIFEATYNIGDFLEAAAYAGHSGAVNEGVMLTLRAFQLWCLGEADAYEARGVIGDALGACDTDHWRTMIALLHRQVAELEERAAKLHLNESTTVRHVGDGVRGGSIVEADRARGRARVARARADEALREIDEQHAASDRLWNRSWPRRRAQV